ncbi:HK97 family phage major capsid protein [Bradyrhizobium sp. JR4.1]|uniref:phage major capsid protein n=1 Tax=Bradyrhizobium sp. JR4.1 TaxID=3156372 RepID=UPI003391D1BC
MNISSPDRSRRSAPGPVDLGKAIAAIAVAVNGLCDDALARRKAEAPDNPILRRAGAFARSQIIKAQNTGTNGTGGAIVPPDILNEMIAIRDPRGAIRGSANVVRMRSDTKSVPRRTAGLTANFVAEASAIPETSFVGDNVGLTAKKLGTLTRMSTEVAEDAAEDIEELGGLFTTEVGYAFLSKEDDCGFNGDGTAAFGGIRGISTLFADGNHNAGRYVATGRSTFDVITATDMANLVAALPAVALPGARFFVSQFGFAMTLWRLASSGSGISWRYVNGVLMPIFMGFPIQITPVLPQSNSGISGKMIMAFGDMSLAATLGDRRQATVKFSGDRYLELDQIAVRGTERIDLVIHDLGDNTAAGPVVGLIAG